MYSFDSHQPYSLTHQLKKDYLCRCYLGGLAPTLRLAVSKGDACLLKKGTCLWKKVVSQVGTSAL